MSRIRSHLDSIVAPKPAHPSYASHHAPHHAPQHAFRPAVSPNAAPYSGNDDALMRIQQRLDALGSAIERSAQENQRAARDAGPVQTIQPQSPSPANRDLDRVRDSLDQLHGKIQAIAAQGERAGTEPAIDVDSFRRSMTDALSQDMKAGFEAIRREMDDLRNDIKTSSGASNGNSEPLQGEIARIAAGIEDLQTSAGLSPDHLSQITSEVQYLRQGLDAIVAKSPANLETAITSMDAKLEDRWNHVASDLQSVRNNIENLGSGSSDQTMLVGMSEHISSMRSMIENLPQALDLPDLHLRLDDISGAVRTLSDQGHPGVESSGIEARLDEITRALVAVSSSPDANTDHFERIEARLASLVKSVELLSETSSANSSVQELRMDQLMMLPEELRSAINVLDQKLAGIPAGHQADLSPIEAQIDRLSRKIDNISAMGSVGSEMLENGQLDVSSLAPLLNRIDELGDQINRLGSATPASADMSATNGAIERLETQIAGIAGQLETAQAAGFAAQGAFDANHGGADIAASQQVLEEIQHLSRRIDEMAAPSSVMPEVEQLSGLERQLSEITAQLGSVGTLGVNLTPIEDRLGNIEDQVAASRDIAIEVATQAAERAVGMASAQSAGEGGGTAVSPELLSGLQADLRDLQDNTRNFNTTNLETFDAVRDTLSVIVTRLSSIEEQMLRPTGGFDHQATHSAPQPAPLSGPAFQGENFDQEIASEQYRQSEQPVSAAFMMQGADQDLNTGHGHDYAMENHDHDHDLGQSSFTGDPLEVEPPRLDMQDLPGAMEGAGHGGDNISDDGPIEPGSGAPDLSALVKQAGQRKRQSGGETGEYSGQPVDGAANSDIVAAARRAARAAQAEAEAQQALEPAEPEKTKKSLFSGLGSFGGLIGNNKKALMAGAAVLVIAALAAPMAGKFLGGSEPQVMSAAPEASAPAGETRETNETASSAAGASEDTVASIDTSQSDKPIELGASPNTNNGGNVANAEEASGAETPGVAGSETQAGENAQVAEQQNAIGSSITSVPMPEVEAGNPALRQAAAEGDAKALFEIARKYTDGEGVTRDMPTAAQWYTRAAERGLAPAQYRIGNIYEKGDGVERDITKAVSWYQQAAEQGNVFAMHNLAALKADQRQLGDAADIGEAVSWFKRAAEFGVKDSQFNLGIIYGKGMGVEADLVEAYKWFAVAAKSGDRRATENRDIIANQMRPDQLDKAKAEADLWKPSEINQGANTVDVPTEWKTKGTSAAVMSQKDQVRFAQATLSKLGFDAGPADGLMGAKTRGAIKAFQQRVGLNVDGEITGELMEALKSVAS